MFIDDLADPAQRVTAAELATLVGMGQDVGIPDAIELPTATLDLDDRYVRFLAQLAERDGPSVSGAVARLIDGWIAQDGKPLRLCGNDLVLPDSAGA